jgi:hypothetical protein
MKVKRLAVAAVPLALAAAVAASGTARAATVYGYQNAVPPQDGRRLRRVRP